MINYPIEKDHRFEVGLCRDGETTIYIRQDEMIKAFSDGKEKIYQYPSRAIFVMNIIAKNKDEAIKVAIFRLNQYKNGGNHDSRKCAFN